MTDPSFIMRRRPVPEERRFISISPQSCGQLRTRSKLTVTKEEGVDGTGKASNFVYSRVRRLEQRSSLFSLHSSIALFVDIAHRFVSLEVEGIATGS